MTRIEAIFFLIIGIIGSWFAYMIVSTVWGKVGMISTFFGGVKPW